MDTAIMAFLGLLVALILGTLVIDGVVSLKNGVGTVSQDRKVQFVSEFREEKDGCIYYVNVYGNEGKTCGAYSINRF